MTEILNQLSGLIADNSEFFWTGFLVFLRVGAAIALMPAFGETVVPQRVRLMAALAFTAIVAPAVFRDGLLAQEGSAQSAFSEVAIGLALGFGMRMFILALQIAGNVVAQATSLSQVFGGATPEPQPAIGNLLVIAGLALAVMSDLHVKAATLLIESYAVLPLGQIPKPADMSNWGLAQIANGFSLAFSLAAPFVIASLIYNIALGVINRAMPQLMVTFVGAPALTAGGLILLVLVAPLALVIWQAEFSRFLGAAFLISR